MAKIYIGIAAGGSGTRMGSALPKQFIEVCGIPVIIRTIRKMCEYKCREKIFVAVPENYISYTEGLIKKFLPGESDIVVLSGGSDRMSTLLNMISEIRKTDSSPDSVLLTHDGVRPFFTREMVELCAEKAAQHGASGVYVPATDTIAVSVDGEAIDSIPDRSTLFNTQTPQAFRIGWFEEDFANLDERSRQTLTDAIGLFLKSGRRVCMVEGSPDNIKLTTPIDLEVARALIEKKGL